MHRGGLETLHHIFTRSISQLRNLNCFVRLKDLFSKRQRKTVPGRIS